MLNEMIMNNLLSKTLRRRTGQIRGGENEDRYESSRSKLYG